VTAGVVGTFMSLSRSERTGPPQDHPSDADIAADAALLIAC